MCYDVEQQHWRVVKHLKRFGTQEEYEKAFADYQRKWNPNSDPKGFHLAGFSHPDLLIALSISPLKIEKAKWGLIPFWVKDEKQALQIWNKTINARGETIFEKPSFRKAAKDGRCLIIVDSFFEHHHFNKQSFPFRIKLKNGEPMIIAGIFDKWVNKQTGEEILTTAIVTTAANPLMAKIHNNPKVPSPRMPLILSESDARNWLGATNKLDIESLIRPSDEQQLEVYTVQTLRGKSALGDVPDAIEPFNYPELPAEIG